MEQYSFYYPPTYDVTTDKTLRKYTYLYCENSRSKSGFDEACNLFQKCGTDGFVTLDQLEYLDYILETNFAEFLRWRHAREISLNPEWESRTFEDRFDRRIVESTDRNHYGFSYGEFSHFRMLFINFIYQQKGRFDANKMDSETGSPKGWSPTDWINPEHESAPSFAPTPLNLEEIDVVKHDQRLNACFDYLLERTNQKWYRYKLNEIFNTMAHLDIVTWHDIRFLENEFGCPLRQYFCNYAGTWCKGYVGVMPMDELRLYIHEHNQYAPDEPRPIKPNIGYEAFRSGFINVVEDAIYNHQW